MLKKKKKSFIKKNLANTDRDNRKNCQGFGLHSGIEETDKVGLYYIMH